MLNMKIFYCLFCTAALLAVNSCEVNEPAGSSPSEPNYPETAPEIAYVTLEPRIPSPASLDDPSAGWPEAGQTVTWKAQVFNKENFLINNVKYKWFVDGNLTKVDSMQLPAGKSEFEFQKPWNSETEDIKFVIETKDSSGRALTDSISFFSKALSAGFWIEQSLYDWMYQDEEIPRFELWARNQVDQWNRILTGGATGGEINTGIKNEIRLNYIEVVSNGSPYPIDANTDLIWYFKSEFHDSRFLQVNSSISVVQDQTIVLHELMHQRGLIDLYAYEILDQTVNGSHVKILDPDGNPAVGSDRLPYQSTNSLYFPSFANALMGYDYIYPTRFSKHSVYGFNLFAEQRSARYMDQDGNLIHILPNQKPSEAIGNTYAAHVPKQTELIIKDSNNNLLKNVFIDVFFDKGFHVYQDVYNENPDFTLETDSSGIVVLTSDPWQDESWRKRFDPNVIILRARYKDDSKWAYQFLPVYYLNLQYIDGNTEMAQMALSFDMQ